jgi:hypothetical protein
MSTNYEDQLSKIGTQNRPSPKPEDEFSTEEMLRMMQETLGVDGDFE